MTRRSAALRAAVVTGLLVAVSCGGRSLDRGDQRARVGGGVPAGRIAVFAAASLTEPFTAIGRRFEASHPGTDVSFSFSASTSLVSQVRAGAPADVIATADRRPLQVLVDAALVSAPQVFARNHLSILVAADNPQGVRSLADLSRPGLVVVLCAVEVPCGFLARQALTRAHVRVEPVSYEPDVKAVVSRVALGEADAGIVYATDVVASAGTTAGVAVAADDDVSTDYAIATVNRTGNQGLAEDFAAYVGSGPAAEVLHRAGFGPA